MENYILFMTAQNLSSQVEFQEPYPLRHISLATAYHLNGWVCIFYEKDLFLWQ